MSAPTPAVFCRAGQWTKVLWSSFLIKQYNGSFSAPGVTIGWRRYSSGPPFYTEGTHNSSQTYGAITFGEYCDFWFRPSSDITVSWT